MCLNIRLEGVRSRNLSIESWALHSEEVWCVWGGNASGKSQIAALLAGEEPSSGEVVDRPRSVSWLSFETQQARFEEELRNDDSDITDIIDIGTTGLELLQQSGCSKLEAVESAREHGLMSLLNKGYRVLSSGETRRLLLLKEILSKPELLILDEPFDGLDVKASAEVSEVCARLVSQGQAMLLLVSQQQDIVPWVTHLALLQAGEIVASGERRAVLELPETQHLMRLSNSREIKLPTPITASARSFTTLVKMENTRVKYGETVQFRDFSWELKAGEHTILSGPNGAGKSTLLQLITGDHPQCYGNGLTVLDYARGSGESVWDIKRHIGIVSAALHRDHRISGTVLSVVVSGFYDSIGLYREPDTSYVAHAKLWLRVIGLSEQASLPFLKLSWGQQRLVLIARGLIKQPPLLILDEPTQGLDDLNRHLVLTLVRRLVDLQRTTVLFVSHREDEHLSLFRRRIEFCASAEPQIRFTLRSVDCSSMTR